MRATSESRTTSPLEPVFSTISPNSSAVRRRPCALIAIRKSLPPLIGSAPSWPAETWMFCSWMARTTSPAVIVHRALGAGVDRRCRRVARGHRRADVDHDAAITAFGRLDILVNNAGIYEWAALGDITEAQYRWMFDTNVLGPLLVTRAAVKHLGE